MDCIFCKIIIGELPSWKIYEDEHTLAFLDIFPVHKGHALVVPKKHCTDFVSADPECLRHVHEVAQKVAKAVIAGTNADGCNVTTNNGVAAGQEVFHLHWHIIPRFENDGLHLWPQSQYADGEKETVQENIKKHL
ncbi:MAG: HIT family protein [Candidatus Uhrbacteria bacterium]|nr:HIT family protein [Candidatus Uhrbacteria bacterium]